MVSEEVIFNPFPGLRPFEEDEDYLFFGREKQIDELLTKLRTTRFLAVVGTSGSGKSSLVKCGLLPGLYGGFMAGTSSSWRIATFRPGNDPIFHMAEALAQPGVLYDHLDPDDVDAVNMHTGMLTATLNRSKRGMVDVVKEARLPQDENLLVVVDQFEELFRYNRQEATASTQERKAVAFVKLLLDAAEQRDQNIFIVITMRSDFLGDCTEFRGLPEVINQGQYLIPRMTREEMKDAITGPIAVGGADISPILLTRLLNDVGERMDQLPVLQHALMRTWERWEKDHEEEENLDLRHYEAIGTMSEALSQHADEIYEQLDGEYSRKDCELIFKAITEKSEGGRGIRRPTRITELMEITNIPFDRIVAVAEAFRQHGRRFLMPPPDEVITQETILDISHESLMRVWRRCIDWVDEEMVSAERYRDLAERAEKWHSYGQVGFLQDPELQLMINWRNAQEPTEAWARRFRNLQFETAMVYLNVSEERRAQIQERERRARRKKVFWLSLFSLFMLVAFIISISLYIESQHARNVAERAQEEAEIQRDSARDARADALLARDDAKSKEQMARNAEQRAKNSEQEAREKEKEARDNYALAQVNEKMAIDSAAAASAARDRANDALGQARTATNIAIQNAIEVENQRNKLDTLQNRERARTLGVNALQYFANDAPDTGKHWAEIAFQINRDYGGHSQNEDIYPALIEAFRKDPAIQKDQYQIPMESYDTRAMVALSSGNAAIIADNNGMIKKVSMGEEMQPLLAPGYFDEPIRQLALSPDQQKVVIGFRNGQVLVQDLSTLTGDQSRRIRQNQDGNTSPITGLSTMSFTSPSGSTEELLLKAQANQLSVTYLASPNQNQSSVEVGTTIQSIVAESGQVFVASGRTLFAYEIQFVDNNPVLEVLNEFPLPGTALITSLALRDGQLAVGLQNGEIFILPTQVVLQGLSAPAEADVYKIRTLHQARITSMAFHPTQPQLLSTSVDGTARLWPLRSSKQALRLNESEDVLTLPDHNAWVWSGCYVGGGKYILTGGQDTKILRWHTDMNELAQALDF